MEELHNQSARLAVEKTLQWADYLVIAAMLCISVGIGIYFRVTGGKQKTMEEYFSANRSMSIIPVGIALMVSFMSAITLLGVSAENYTYGTQFVVINLSYLIGTPIICYFYLPVFFNLQATSAYEYLEKRFGVLARLTASLAYWIQLLLYSGVVLYAPSLALEATTGLSKTASIIIIGLVCTFYSSIGGIKAVLVTDLFQGLLMFVALFIVIGTAASAVGGLDEIWEIAVQGNRIEFDSISTDPTVRHTWWGLIIGGLFTFLSLFGVHQVQVQRMLTVKNLKSAQLALWLNWPILTALSILTCFSGLAMYSKYYQCDPLKQGRITSMDMLMPLYVMDTMSHLPGLPGLFIAGIFSAGLSTISAALNSLAAVTLEDYIKPVYAWYAGDEISAKKSTIISKILAFVFGLACIAVAFLAQFLGGVLQASLTIFGVVGGPLLGIFTLGMLTKSASEKGSVIGVIVSLGVLLWIAFGQPRPLPPTLPVSTDGCEAGSITKIGNSTKSLMQDDEYFYLYRISYMWYSAIGFVMTFVIGLVISNVEALVTGKKETDLDPNLFFPIIARGLHNKRHMVNDNNSDLNCPTNADINKRYNQKDVHDNIDNANITSTHV